MTERRTQMRRWAILVILIGLTVGACGTTDTTITTAGGTSTTNPQTQELIVYSGRNENFISPIVEAFTEATGVQVRVRYGDGTSDLAATVMNEGETTNADIFWSQDPAWIGAVGDRGLLADLPDD